MGEDIYSLEVVIRDYPTIGTSEKKFDLDIPEPVVLEEATHKPETIDLNSLSIKGSQSQQMLKLWEQLQTVLICDKTGEAKFDLRMAKACWYTHHW